MIKKKWKSVTSAGLKLRRTASWKCCHANFLTKSQA